MKALVIGLFGVLLVTAPAAFADANVLKPPRVYAPNGPPRPGRSKAGSFAPRAGASRRRVYGAPVQGRIFKMQPKPTAPPGGRPPSR
ncbi:MAG: hypothetical protein ACREU6_02140 [Steroidobacteraceae bacterium]